MRKSIAATVGMPIAMKAFPYRSVKSAYAAAAIPFALLILMELALVSWLVWRFIDPGPWRAVASGGLLAVGAAPLVFMLAPLFGSHRVDSKGCSFATA